MSIRPLCLFVFLFVGCDSEAESDDDPCAAYLTQESCEAENPFELFGGSSGCFWGNVTVISDPATCTVASTTGMCIGAKGESGGCLGSCPEAPEADNLVFHRQSGDSVELLLDTGICGATPVDPTWIECDGQSQSDPACACACQ